MGTPSWSPIDFVSGGQCCDVTSAQNHLDEIRRSTDSTRACLLVWKETDLFQSLLLVSGDESHSSIATNLRRASTSWRHRFPRPADPELHHNAVTPVETLLQVGGQDQRSFVKTLCRSIPKASNIRCLHLNRVIPIRPPGSFTVEPYLFLVNSKSEPKQRDQKLLLYMVHGSSAVLYERFRLSSAIREREFADALLPLTEVDSANQTALPDLNRPEYIRGILQALVRLTASDLGVVYLRTSP